MDKRISYSSAVFAVLAALFALVLLITPAMAHHKGGHGQGGGKAASGSDHDGDADSNSGTTYTEDNDSDGTPNNVEDDGDNRHPSGKDRSVENGGAGNQGNSESAPDEDGHGAERDYNGTDKPNGPGGVDVEDQDGNNGCGNDDDFEDDNEGWCGKPKTDESDDDVGAVSPRPGTPTTPPDVGGDLVTVPPSDDEVLGNRVTRTSGPAVAAVGAPRVAGAGAALPFTGAGGVIVFLLVALALIALGSYALRAGRSRA